MKKMKVSSFKNWIKFTEDKINILEIHDKKLFSKISLDFYKILNNIEPEEKIILIEGNKSLNFKKQIIYITDFVKLDSNSRKNIKKLYESFEEDLNYEYESKSEFENLLAKIKEIFDELFDNYNFDIVLNDNIKIKKLFKLFGVRIKNSEEKSILERLINFINFCGKFENDKIIIFCNMKTFFKKQELEEIYKCINSNKLNVLLLESSRDNEIKKGEKKLIIDELYDDFLVEL